MTREHRKLAAIVATDVVGYSRLMGMSESGTLTALKAIRNDLIDPTIAAHGGRIVKTTGDGMLLEYPSVVEAFRSCVEIETAMSASAVEGCGRTSQRQGRRSVRGYRPVAAAEEEMNGVSEVNARRRCRLSCNRLALATTRRSEP